MAQLSDVLGSIPGLGGYLAKQQFDQQQGTAELANAGQFMRLQQGFQQQNEDANLKRTLASGGTPDEIINALLKSGPKGAAMAHQYAQAVSEMGKATMMKDLTGRSMADSPETVERLRRAGMVHPMVLPSADRMEGRLAAREQLPMIQGQQQPITETPQMGQGGVMRSQIPEGGPMMQTPATTQPVPPEVAAAMQSGQPFSVGVGPSANPAENQQKTGGMFSAFSQSANPAIRAEAQRLGAFADSLTPQTATPAVLARLQARADQLGTLEAQAANTQSRQQFAVDNRREPTDKPLTKEAKLNADLAAGRIDQTQYDMASGKPVQPDAKTLEMDALRYLTDGTMPPNMGRGQQGATEAKAIRTRAAALADELGVSPEDIRANQSNAKAIGSALAGVQRQKANVLTYEKTALGGAVIAKEMSDKVNRDTGVPVLDKWVQAGRKGLAGDVDVTRLHNAVETFTNEYAKVMSGSSGGQATTVSMQQHARELLQGAFTKEQFNGAIDLMIREMKETREPAFDNQIAEMKAQLKSGVKPQGAAAAPSAASASPTQYPTATAPNGRKVIYKDGKWQTP